MQSTERVKKWTSGFISIYLIMYEIWDKNISNEEYEKLRNSLFKIKNWIKLFLKIAPLRHVETCRRRLGRGFWVCLRSIVRSVEFGSGGIQVEGLQYVERLVVRGWFLKQNCFFIVEMRQLANFWTRWCVEAGHIGTKLWPKVSASVSIEDSWWEERFPMVLFLKLVSSC